MRTGEQFLSNDTYHDATYPGRDKGDENEDEDISDDESHITGDDALLSKGDIRLHKRTRVP